MRLDQALAHRGLTRSRNQAARLIAQGQVTVNGVRATKASQQISEDALVAANPEPWVSRAAYKLLGALKSSGTRVPPRVLDAGASTGGFTQVCLRQGAERVYAIDVGHGQLADELRLDPRVESREGLNLRELTLEHVEDVPVQLIVADVSFISLTLLLAPLAGVLAPGGSALVLVKPQFEVGKQRLGAAGVVSSPEDREDAVARVRAHAVDLGWRPDWQAESELPGADGNIETFLRLRL